MLQQEREETAYIRKFGHSMPVKQLVLDIEDTTKLNIRAGIASCSVDI